MFDVKSMARGKARTAKIKRLDSEKIQRSEDMQSNAIHFTLDNVGKSGLCIDYQYRVWAKLLRNNLKYKEALRMHALASSFL